MLEAQRPHQRDDGWPTRADTTYWTMPEVAISHAMRAVEAAGASPALTDAVNLLDRAQKRVADHVEALPEAMQHFGLVTLSKAYTQEQLDAAVAEAVDRDRITNFLLFARDLPDGPASLVYGTSLSAKAVARALDKAGYK